MSWMALSDSASEGPTDAQLSVIAARQLLAFAAVAAATCLVVRGIGHLSERVGRAYLYSERLADLPRVLPVWAASDQPQVLVIGSSAVEQEVFTEILDAELIKAGRRERAYNLGMDSMVPDLLPRLVHFVLEAYQQGGHRPAAIVIEVSPDWFTWEPNEQMEMDYLAHLGSPREFLSRLRQSPEDGLILFGRRYALGGFSGDYITYRLTRWLDMDVPSYFGELTENQRVLALKRLPPTFTVENHGSSNDPEHATENQRYADSVPIVRQWLADDEVATISGPFREPAVQNALAAIREAQAGANKVFLLAVPRNPCFMPAEFQQRADQLISRFVKETGASVLDFRSEDRNCDDFEDLLHLLPLTGGPGFSRALGRTLAERL
jgi:hypothetical protein